MDSLVLTDGLKVSDFAGGCDWLAGQPPRSLCFFTYSTSWVLTGTGLFQCLDLLRVAKINRAVVNSDASSFPDIFRVRQVLFLKSDDFMGMPQSCMLDFLSFTSVIWLIAPLWQLFDLQALCSQDSAFLSTRKLSSQHVLGRVLWGTAQGPWLQRPRREQLHTCPLCGGHGSSACAVESHSACTTVILTLFQCLAGQDSLW